MEKPLLILIIKDGNVVDVKSYLQEKIIIGSIVAADLQIQDPSVAHIHALVEVSDEDQVVVTDLGSQTGTFVGGQKVDVETVIKLPFRLKIGNVELSLEGVSLKKPEAPASSVDSASTTQKKSSSPAKHAKTKKLEGPQLFGSEVKGGNVVEIVTSWGKTTLDLAHFHMLGGDRKVTIGCSVGDDVEACIPDMFEGKEFINIHKGKTFFSVVPGMKGMIRSQGKMIPLSDSIASMELHKGDFAKMSLGPLEYFLCLVEPPPPPDLKTLKEGDPLLYRIMVPLMMATMILMTIVSMMELPKGAKELDQADDHLVTIHRPQQKIKKPPVVKKKVELEKVKKDKVLQKKKPPVKPPKEEVTKKPIKLVTAKQAPKSIDKKVDKRRSALRGESNRKDNRNPGRDKGPGRGGGGKAGGAKGRFSGQRKGTGNADQFAGVNLDKFGQGVGKVLNVDGVGGIATGLTASSAGGSGGSGSGKRTRGLGGIGKGASLSVGGPGGSRDGIGGGSGFYESGGGSGGSGRYGNRRRGEYKVSMSHLDPVLKGSLERHEIEAVMRENQSKIRHCYERQLNRYPDLRGKVIMHFTIGNSGRVTSASPKSTIPNKAVGSCITKVVKRMQFPKPRGGGGVDVKYPFTFSSTG